MHHKYTGRFLAEVTKQVLTDLEASKYQVCCPCGMRFFPLYPLHINAIMLFFSIFQMAEYRISVYGRKQSEWDQLASWFVNNSLHSENAVWLIQVICFTIFHLSSNFVYIHHGYVAFSLINHVHLLQ